MTLVLSIDPGGGTGYASHRVNAIGKPIGDIEVGCFLNTEEGHHLELWEFLHLHKPEVIVCEDFIYMVKKSKGTVMPNVELISKDYIGIIKLYALTMNERSTAPTVRLVMRTPGQGFIVYTDDLLKRLGLYTRGTKDTNGAPHINDAVRHLLGFLIDTCERKDYLDPIKPIR